MPISDETTRLLKLLNFLDELYNISRAMDKTEQAKMFLDVMEIVSKAKAELEKSDDK